MATKTEAQKEAEAVAKRALARESEPDEHKTIRRLVRETMDEWADENLASDEGEGAKPSGGGGFLETLLGKKPGA
jgi:hypothetical protein